MKLENQSFWADVEHDFNMWGMAVHGLNLPTLAELDRYWASIASNGEIESSLGERVQADYTLYPGSEDRQNAVRDALYTVQDQKILTAIQDGIEKELCDSEFFWAWTKYQRCVAVLLVLSTADEESQKDFNQRSSQKSAIVQRYIYAHWMYERWARPSLDGIKLEENARINSQQDLAEEIMIAIKEKALSSAEKECLESMIGYKGSIPHLKGKILHLTANELCNIVEKGDIQKGELPPLPY